VTLKGERIYRIPIVIEPYPDQGFSVRSPLLPELISEGDTFEEAISNARDAVQAVLEMYEDLNKQLPPEMLVEEPATGPVGFDLYASVSA
jgi:antitoxin HicB